MHAQLLEIAYLTIFSMMSLWLGWRLKVPSIVFFLISGFVAGPIMGLLHPEELFGDLLPSFISIAVGIILFEGSLTLNFKELREARHAVRQFVIIGAPVAWCLTTLIAHYIAGLSWAVSITFGALLIVTGPTVIMPLLKNAKLQNRTGSLLKWEGIINDPIGAILAVLSYEFFAKAGAGQEDINQYFISTGMSIIIISAVSIAAAYFLRWVFNRNFVPEYLKSPFTLSFVIVFFVLCNEILHESGLIAVTILGVAMANLGIRSIEELKRFKESISLMLISGVFIILTARIEPEILFNISFKEILFIAMLLLVVRPITVFCSSLFTKMTYQEVLYAGWIAPRGIVCAAIAGIMGPQLVAAGYADGEQLLPLAFAIVLATVFLHGFTAKPLGRLLGLSYPDQDSLIIVGASSWALQLAETLKLCNINVLIADNNWYKLKEARLGNFETYYGEILSEETEYNLELNQYNLIFAATNNVPYNTLVCNKFGHEFGRESTYQILAQNEDGSERKQITETLTGRYFAHEELNYWNFVKQYAEGWRFKATDINEKFNTDDIRARIDSEEAIIIGRIKKGNGKVSFHSYDIERFEDGDTILLFQHQDETNAE